MSVGAIRHAIDSVAETSNTRQCLGLPSIKKKIRRARETRVEFKKTLKKQAEEGEEKDKAAGNKKQNQVETSLTVSHAPHCQAEGFGAFDARWASGT